MDATQTEVPDRESSEDVAAAPAAVAQAEQPSAPATGEESARTAATAGGAADGATEQRSVLQEFLRDGAPQVQEEEAARGSQQRPVDLGQQGDGSPPETAPPADPVPREERARGAQTAPDEEPPRETAAEEPLSGGGTSLYQDDFGGPSGTASADEVTVNLAGDPILPEGEDPLIIEQFGDPVVLSSSAFALAGTQDVATSNFAAPPPEPINEPDPLTEQQIAAGDAEADGDGSGPPAGSAGNDISGTAGDDTLIGGDGNDIFSFSTATDEGDDVIRNFGSGDVLRLSDVMDADGSGSVDLADLDEDAGNSVSDAGGSLVLGFSSGTTVTLEGIDGSGVTSFSDLAGTVNVDFA